LYGILGGDGLHQLQLRATQGFHIRTRGLAGKGGAGGGDDDGFRDRREVKFDGDVFGGRSNVHLLGREAGGQYFHGVGRPCGLVKCGEAFGGGIEHGHRLSQFEQLHLSAGDGGILGIDDLNSDVG
jgi:hypothetical protein